jgi:hypothetical protein
MLLIHTPTYISHLRKPPARHPLRHPSHRGSLSIQVFALAAAEPSSFTVVVLSVLELYNDHFIDLLTADAVAAAAGVAAPGGSAAARRRPAARQSGGFLSPRNSGGGSGGGGGEKIEVVRDGRRSTLRGDYTRLQVGGECRARGRGAAGVSERGSFPSSRGRQRARQLSVLRGGRSRAAGRRRRRWRRRWGGGAWG